MVDVVAPSSPFDRTLAWRGLGWLTNRYRVRYDRSAFDMSGYLAGNDERRRAELNRALRAEDVRAVIAIRGGYGANRIAHQLDWDAFVRSPKWLVGFSDITALHIEACARSIASIHGPMVAMLGRGSQATRDTWIDAVEHPSRTRAWSSLDPIRTGNASGPLFAGNLAMIHACAAACRLRVPDGAIVVLEDVGERPYRVDRMLTTLIVGGHFDRVSGFVLGEFTECFPGIDGICVEDVLNERLGSLGVPIASGFPMGHGLRNEPVHIGAPATLEVRMNHAVLTVNG